MPLFNQITDFQSVDAELIDASSVDANAQVEPLSGVTTLDDLMDRFPETVYQQGRDTLLYKFLTALCGDSGAGYVKRLAYASRLKNESELLTFDELDSFYQNTLRFARLKSELVDFDPDVVLPQSDWDAIQHKDQAFRHRIMDFFLATRLGNSPEAMAMAAQAGSGVQCECVENYKYIFDTLSDDVLGVAFNGTTNSVSEFIINPRLLNEFGAPNLDVAYQMPWVQTFTYTSGAVTPDYTTFVGVWQPTTAYAQGVIVQPSVPTGFLYQVTVAGTSGTTEPAWPTFGTVLSGNVTFTTVSPAGNTSTQAIYRMQPDIERNMVDLLDRLRPVSAFMSVNIHDEHYRPITFSPDTVSASSERFLTVRYVTGSTQTQWPDPNPARGTFVIQSQEVEVPKAPLSGRDLAIVFQSLNSIRAYTNRALEDAAYNTASFTDPLISPVPFERYRSEHTGAFRSLAPIYTFLKNVPADDVFSAVKALAIHDTPLIFEGRSK